MSMADKADTLPSGHVLRVDDTLVSNNGLYKFINQVDSNLCIYDKNQKATWASGSYHKGPGNLHMQTDGNLVLYKGASGQAVWASDTWKKGTGPYKLIMQDDGNLVIYDANSVPTWTSNTGVGSDVPPRDTLPSGDVLRIDDKLVSNNKMYKFVNQADSNLCIYDKHKATWASGSWHKGPGYLHMQTDGNLVLYKGEGRQADRQAVWASDTWRKGTGPYKLIMQDDGNLVIYDANSVPTWASNTGIGSDVPPRDTLPSGDVLRVDDTLVSTNGLYKFINQVDSNLCIYDKNQKATWASGSYHKGPGNLHMQTDGNLVLYKGASGQAVWASDTWKKGTGPYKLIMQDDGNLVIYDANSVPTWASNTGIGSDVPPRDTLPSGDVLRVDDTLVSNNRLYKFINQVDSNLCIYDKNQKATWASGSWHKGPGSLHMQTDGNLVLYKGDSGKAVWASDTWRKGTGPYKLIMQDDGNLVIYDVNSVPTWATNTGVGFGRWASGTNNERVGNLYMQRDGNLVPYNTNHGNVANPRTPIRSSGCRKGTVPYKLIMQDGGNLVIYDTSHKRFWATNTY